MSTLKEGKFVIKTNHPLMEVKSIEECSKGSILLLLLLSLLLLLLFKNHRKQLNMLCLLFITQSAMLLQAFEFTQNRTEQNRKNFIFSSQATRRWHKRTDIW